MFNFENDGINSIQIKISNNANGSNEKIFYLGKTGILELQDVEIRYISFPRGLPNNINGIDPYMTIDFQLTTGGTDNETIFSQ